MLLVNKIEQFGDEVVVTFGEHILIDLMKDTCLINEDNQLRLHANNNGVKENPFGYVRDCVRSYAPIRLIAKLAKPIVEGKFPKALAEYEEHAEPLTSTESYKRLLLAMLWTYTYINKREMIADEFLSYILRKESPLLTVCANFTYALEFSDDDLAKIEYLAKEAGVSVNQYISDSIKKQVESLTVTLGRV